MPESQNAQRLLAQIDLKLDVLNRTAQTQLELQRKLVEHAETQNMLLWLDMHVRRGRENVDAVRDLESTVRRRMGEPLGPLP